MFVSINIIRVYCISIFHHKFTLEKVYIFKSTFVHFAHHQGFIISKELGAMHSGIARFTMDIVALH